MSLLARTLCFSATTRSVARPIAVRVLCDISPCFACTQKRLRQLLSLINEAMSEPSDGMVRALAWRIASAYPVSR